MRDNIWLNELLDRVWADYFHDVPRMNNVVIKFGRRSKRRLASIKQRSLHDKNSDTEIKLTSYYIDERVPKDTVIATIAHELCHYAHGFASPLPKFCKFPHQGRVVDRELIKRGLKDHLHQQKDWLERNWNNIVKSNIDRVRSTRRRVAKKRRIPLIKNIFKNLKFLNL